MGQYYMVYTNRNGKEKVYDRHVDGEYTMAKLTEHSWWYNAFVNTICYKIHKKPTQIAWVGDYSDDDNADLHNKVWGNDVKTYGVTEAQVSLFDKYLVNHDKKQYIACNRYYESSEKEDWCLHPLPLLTAVGNGKGGGDYRGINKDMIGIWALDTISVENKKPNEKYEELIVSFKEG